MRHRRQPSPYRRPPRGQHLHDEVGEQAVVVAVRPLVRKVAVVVSDVPEAGAQETADLEKVAHP